MLLEAPPPVPLKCRVPTKDEKGEEYEENGEKTSEFDNVVGELVDDEVDELGRERGHREVRRDWRL